jgi:hypothetical protein
MLITAPLAHEVRADCGFVVETGRRNIGCDGACDATGNLPFDVRLLVDGVHGLPRYPVRHDQLLRGLLHQPDQYRQAYVLKEKTGAAQGSAQVLVCAPGQQIGRHCVSVDTPSAPRAMR